MRFEDVSNLNKLYSKLGINMSIEDMKSLFEIVSTEMTFLGERHMYMRQNNIGSTAWNSPPTIQTMDITLLPNGKMGSSSMKHWMNTNTLNDLNMIDDPVSWGQNTMYSQICGLSVEQAQKIANALVTFVDIITPEHRRTVALAMIKKVIGRPAFDCKKFETVAPKIDNFMRDFISEFIKTPKPPSSLSPFWIALIVIVSIVATAIIAALFFRKRKRRT